MLASPDTRPTEAAPRLTPTSSTWITWSSSRLW
jgi:hypothetical protein